MLDGISLKHTDAVEGLFRKDIFDKIKAMKPGFVRSPGGNYLEGFGLRTRWDWKATVGPAAARPGHYNAAWGYLFRSKVAPSLPDDSAPAAPLASLKAQPRPQQPQAAPHRLGSQRSLMESGGKVVSK